MTVKEMIDILLLHDETKRVVKSECSRLFDIDKIREHRILPNPPYDDDEEEDVIVIE